MLTSFTKDEWDKKVVGLDGSILQSWDWGQFQESLGFKIHRFSSDDYVNQVIEMPLLANKKYLYSPRGPLGDARLAITDLSDLGKHDSNIVFARVEPSQKIDLPRSIKETQPINNWLLDLEKSEDQLLIDMKTKTRYNINLAQRKGLVVREGSKEDLIYVYKLLLETAGRNKFRLHPQDYYWQMWEKLHQNNLKILIAEYEGKSLACMLLTLFGSTATYLHGGSSNAMKEAMAPYVLHWEAIKIAKRLGYKYYDFGGIAPEESTGHAWSGISRFKRSFGGFEVTFPGSFELVFSPLWYNVYKQGRKLKQILRNK